MTDFKREARRTDLGWGPGWELIHTIGGGSLPDALPRPPRAIYSVIVVITAIAAKPIVAAAM